MITKELLKQIIYEQHEVTIANTIPRPIRDEWLLCEEIIVLSGIRRCGKSILLQQIREKCTENDFYFNFEDERLIGFSVADFQMLHECFIEIYGVQHTWFFDEIQNIPEWERFVRRLFNSGHKIYITGSNANMLSRELGTHLTGRCIQIELFPFSFQEFLRLRQFQWDNSALYKTEIIAQLQYLFREYLALGGFPAFLKNKSGEYLSSLYHNIIYRDVLQRNHLTSDREMLQLMNYLASNGAKMHSFASLGKICGIRHPETIKNYLSFLEETYLISTIYKYSPSLKVQMASPKKVYLIDNALMSRIGFNPTYNLGPLLENLVFLELRRRGHQVFYHSSKYECDFVIQQGSHIPAIYQVSVDITDSRTLHREIDGLLDAAREYSPEHRYILTLSDERVIQNDEQTIEILPVWKWLLNKDAF